MSAIKERVTISIKPHVRDQIDELAAQMGLSRSACIDRVMSIVTERLSRSDCGMVAFSKKHMTELLSV